MERRTVVFAAALTLVGHGAFANVVIDQANPGGWIFSDADNVPSGTAVGQFVTGPSTPPLGTGSANLQVGDPNSSEILINTGINPGVLNSSFTASYQTFVTSSTPGSGDAPTLQFDLTNGTTYFGRLVFDPGLLPSGSVVDGQWQGWSTGSSSAWYLSHSGTQFSGQCGINSPCSLSTIEGDLVMLGVTAEDVLFKAGSGQSNFNGNVDDLTLTIGNATTTYDFDPNPVQAPEPASLAVLGIGVLGLVRVRSQRANSAGSSGGNPRA
jgi:hypothetical protein